MAFANQSFDSLDDADESLLVSPTVNRSSSQSRADNNGEHVDDASNVRSGGSSNNNNNRPMFPAAAAAKKHAMSSDERNDSGNDESFRLGAAETPIKSKFNYASAMEELEYLAPTPATNRKKKKKIEVGRCPDVDDGPLFASGCTEEEESPAVVASPVVESPMIAIEQHRPVEKEIVASSSSPEEVEEAVQQQVASPEAHLRTRELAETLVPGPTTDSASSSSLLSSVETASSSPLANDDVQTSLMAIPSQEAVRLAAATMAPAEEEEALKEPPDAEECRLDLMPAHQQRSSSSSRYFAAKGAKSTVTANHANNIIDGNAASNSLLPSPEELEGATITSGRADAQQQQPSSSSHNNSAADNNPFSSYAAKRVDDGTTNINNNAASVFRQSNSNNNEHNPDLELKLGRPANESYDSVEYPHLLRNMQAFASSSAADGCDDDGNNNGVNDADLSMEVTKDAEKNGEYLGASSRIDNVDMDAVGVEIGSEKRWEEAGGLNVNSTDSSVGHDGTDESEDAAKPDLLRDDSNNEPKRMNSFGSYDHNNRPKFRPPLLLGGEDPSNQSQSRRSYISNRRGVNKRNTPFDHSSLDISQDVSSLDSSCSSSDDDNGEELKKKNSTSEYVVNMRESIASYFSSHSSGSNNGNNLDDASPKNDVGIKNDSFESSNLDGSMDDKADTVAKEQLTPREADVSQETQETSYSEGADGDMLNLSALGSDASQIDVDETLEYVGQVQNIQYLRYENVLGELNDKLQQQQQDSVGSVDLGESHDNDDGFKDEIDQDELENNQESEPIAANTSDSSGNENLMDAKVQQRQAEDQFAFSSSDALMNTTDGNINELEGSIESDPIAEKSYSSENSDVPTFAAEGIQSVEDQQVEPTSCDDLIDTSFDSNVTHDAPEDAISPMKLPKEPEDGTESEPIIADATSPPDNKDAKGTAEDFCGAVIETSVVGISSRSPAGDVNGPRKLPSACETIASPDQQPSSESQLEVDGSFENKSIGDESPRDSLFLDGNVSQPTSQTNIFTQKQTKPFLEAALLGPVPDELSPISKNSSPHNSCDLPNSTELTKDNRLDSANDSRTNKKLPTILDTSSLTERSSPRDYEHHLSRDFVAEHNHENIATGIRDEMKNDIVDHEDNCSQEPIDSDATSERSGANCSSGNGMSKKASIFQVLSQPVQETSDNNLFDSMKESGQGTIHEQDRSLEVAAEQPSVRNESVDSQHQKFEIDTEQPFAHNDNVENNDEVALGTMKNGSPPSETYPTVDEFNDTPESEGKRKSLEDLSSYQQNFHSTSSAFLERLRGAADNRKHQILSGRYSMERKEQILYEEKKELAEMPMPAVDEEMVEEPARKSVTNRPRKNIEGDDPYKPFRARPLPSTTERKRASAAHVPKNTNSVPQRKSFAPGQNPYIPFKARPMPGVSHSRPSASLGAKRKSSTVFKPHPAQNKAYVKSSALNAKPPKRLLSGEDASIANEIRQKKRVQEEEARIRRDSVFKARPLPMTTLTRSQGPLVGEDLVPKKAARSGKENSSAFIPRSSVRAEERAAYDAERVEREHQQRQEQMEQRNQVIDQTSAEIADLKKFIR